MLTEDLEFLSLMLSSLSFERLKGLSQEQHFEFDDCTIVNSIFREGRRVLQVGWVQGLVCDQSFWTYKQWVAGKHRKTLVRRIAVTSGSQRQKLPETLPGANQRICKLISHASQVSYSELARERRWMQQYATCSRKTHANLYVLRVPKYEMKELTVSPCFWLSTTGLLSWNVCLHQYTIGHSSKQCFLIKRTANGKRFFCTD